MSDDKTAEMLFADALAEFPVAAAELAVAEPRLSSNGKRLRADGTGFSLGDPLPLKFLARVKLGSVDECWPWQAYIAASGYGLMGPRYAHRMAWEFANGPIPAGLTINHLCFNPACCNPRHLQLLSRSLNSSWQRPFRKTHCKRGHDLTLAENVYWSKAGRRYCKHCVRTNQRAYAARRRAAA